MYILHLDLIIVVESAADSTPHDVTPPGGGGVRAQTCPHMYMYVYMRIAYVTCILYSM